MQTTTTTEMTAKKAALFTARMQHQAAIYTELINEVETIIVPLIQKYDGKNLTKRLENAVKAAQSDTERIHVWLDTTYSTKSLRVNHWHTYKTHEGCDITAQHHEFWIDILTDNCGRVKAADTLERWEKQKANHIATRDQWLKDTKRYAKAQRMAEKIDALIQEYAETYSQELRREFWVRHSHYLK